MLATPRDSFELSRIKSNFGRVKSGLGPLVAAVEHLNRVGCGVLPFDCLVMEAYHSSAQWGTIRGITVVHSRTCHETNVMCCASVSMHCGRHCGRSSISGSVQQEWCDVLLQLFVLHFHSFTLTHKQVMSWQHPTTSICTIAVIILSLYYPTYMVTLSLGFLAYREFHVLTCSLVCSLNPSG